MQKHGHKVHLILLRSQHDTTRSNRLPFCLLLVVFLSFFPRNSHTFISFPSNFTESSSFLGPPSVALSSNCNWCSFASRRFVLLFFFPLSIIPIWITDHKLFFYSQMRICTKYGEISAGASQLLIGLRPFLFLNSRYKTPCTLTSYAYHLVIFKMSSLTIGSPCIFILIKPLNTLNFKP